MINVICTLTHAAPPILITTELPQDITCKPVIMHCCNFNVAIACYDVLLCNITILHAWLTMEYLVDVTLEYLANYVATLYNV